MLSLRAATIRLAHENPELRPYLLPLLVETTSRTASMEGWKREEKPGSALPVVYVRKHGGKTFRVAPSSTREGKWVLDVLEMTGWERYSREDGDTPEEAASFLQEGSRTHMAASLKITFDRFKKDTGRLSDGTNGLYTYAKIKNEETDLDQREVLISQSKPGDFWDVQVNLRHKLDWKSVQLGKNIPYEEARELAIRWLKQTPFPSWDAAP